MYFYHDKGTLVSIGKVVDDALAHCGVTSVVSLPLELSATALFGKTRNVIFNFAILTLLF